MKHENVKGAIDNRVIAQKDIEHKCNKLDRFRRRK